MDKNNNETQKNYDVPNLPLKFDLETPLVLKELNLASRSLAGLNGEAKSIPNELILIDTLSIQEAHKSSEIENIITTQDDLYQSNVLLDEHVSIEAKEVHQYVSAIKLGYQKLKEDGLITNTLIKEMQEVLEGNDAGYRSVQGTVLKNPQGEVIYEPPQDKEQILSLMDNLVKYINDSSLCELDPLIKMAIIHHQFESIHPFYDGNGRTGRMLNILYLIKEELLDTPILYLSQYINQNKKDYYSSLQNVRKDGTGWEEWIVFMLRGIHESAKETRDLVKKIGEMMAQYKEYLKANLSQMYSHELINTLFRFPYTKIAYIQKYVDVSERTAIRYLNTLVDHKLLIKEKKGKESYYINQGLCKLFTKL